MHSTKIKISVPDDYRWCYMPEYRLEYGGGGGRARIKIELLKITNIGKKL
jgi:hypothetical protein